MKILLKTLPLLSLILISMGKGFSITNFEINKICGKERLKKDCIKRLKINRDLIEKGKPIEIPVIEYKR